MSGSPAEPSASGSAQDGPTPLEGETDARARTVQKLVAAARPLFADRGPSRVSLREVASAAGVNYGLIYQYVGTKDDLLRLVFRTSSQEWADQFAHADDAQSAIALLMRPKSSEYVRMLAHSLLEGRDPVSLLGRSPAMLELIRKVEASRPSSGPDPRVGVATLTAIGLGWGLFGAFVKTITGLEEASDDELTTEIYALVRRSVFAPPAAEPRPGDAGH